MLNGSPRYIISIDSVMDSPGRLHRLRFTGFYFGKFLRINTLLVFCDFHVRGIYWTEGKTGQRQGATANTHRVFSAAICGRFAVPPHG